MTVNSIGKLPKWIKWSKVKGRYILLNKRNVIA